jgi:ABC-type multidrug transport system permease subunit
VTSSTISTPEVTGAAEARVARFGTLGLLRVVTAAAWAIGKTRMQTTGVMFYLMIWFSFPLFNLITVALIYRHDPTLRNYAIIGGAGMAMLFGMQFNAGEILDTERRRGTLGNLFLSPAPRYSWLGGFQLFSACEALSIAILSVAVGKAVFGLPLDIDPETLVVSLVLFMCSMWGFSMMVGALGVVLRNANQFSNLLFPLMQLFAGTMYPIALMTAWVRVPARWLPFGYGIQALADSMTQAATPAQEAGQLLPLACFAVALPLLGVVAFRAVERRTRNTGTLELV